MYEPSKSSACWVTLLIRSSQFVREVLNTPMLDDPDDEGNIEEGRMFYLVESRHPGNREKLRKELQANETVETDFIDATPEDCQRWANERCRHDRAPFTSLIAIVDARSAQDGTILIQKYVTEKFPFGGYGMLPQETNVWYDFRVNRRGAWTVFADLSHTSPDVTYPIYFGSKDSFTDENGVFDVREAGRYCKASDPVVRESEIYQRKFWPQS